MDISRVFKVFSRRPQQVGSSPEPLTPEFRNRVIQLCLATFPVYQSYVNRLVPTLSEFWGDIHQSLLYVHGVQSLSGRATSDLQREITSFLLTCSDGHFFDFIELIFQSSSIWQSLDPRTGNRVRVDELIDNINSFLEADGLPYYLTAFTLQNGQIEAYPQIIPRDSVVLHQTAMKPVLALLSRPGFTSANEEFLDALKDLRSGDYRDCVVKCGSAFESVMKVICEQNGWPVGKNAGKLLNTVLSKTNLPGFLKQPLIQIATIRNELGSAHGAGAQPRNVPNHIAQYTINATASAILLLVEETDP